MQVKNHSGLPVQVGRLVIPSRSVAEVDEAYLYQTRITRLRQKGILEFPYKGEPTGTKVLELVTEVKPPEDKVVIESSEPGPDDTTVLASPDDLTALVHIGTGRAQKLADNGVDTYLNLSATTPELLKEMLNVTHEQAVEIIDGAKEKVA